MMIRTRQMCTSISLCMPHDAYDIRLTFAFAESKYVCAQGMLATTAPFVLALGVLGCAPSSAAPASSW